MPTVLYYNILHLNDMYELYRKLLVFESFDFFKGHHHARIYILYSRSVLVERVYRHQNYYYCAIVFCNYTAHTPADPLTNGRQWI